VLKTRRPLDSIVSVDAPRLTVNCSLLCHSQCLHRSQPAEIDSARRQFDVFHFHAAAADLDFEPTVEQHLQLAPLGARVVDFVRLPPFDGRRLFVDTTDKRTPKKPRA
jgi:hypothetical protein